MPLALQSSITFRIGRASDACQNLPGSGETLSQGSPGMARRHLTPIRRPISASVAVSPILRPNGLSGRRPGCEGRITPNAVEAWAAPSPAATSIAAVQWPKPGEGSARSILVRPPEARFTEVSTGSPPRPDSSFKRTRTLAVTGSTRLLESSICSGSVPSPFSLTSRLPSSGESTDAMETGGNCVGASVDLPSR